MAQISVAQMERLEKRNTNLREKMREGARLGTNSLISTLGGGIASGWFEAEYPKLLGTDAPTSLVVGLCLVGGALAGVFDEYGDEAAALGSGMIAATVSRVAESYFAS